MTRVLSELLDATEPMFSQTVRQLERLTGHPSADIRLTTDLQTAGRAKLRELGLDGKDTTGRELYATLGERLKADEQRFRSALHDDTDGNDDVIAQVIRAVQGQISPQPTFAIKNAVLRRLLKANPPKKTTKLLGYRSVDSMLKHESPASLYAAASLVESVQWHKRHAAGYAKLTATDFEVRLIAIEYPVAARWQQVADTVVAVQKEYVLTLKELGTVVLLPLPATEPKNCALLSAVLLIRGLNDCQAAGTYLKLRQMEPVFGKLVQQAATGEPLTTTMSLEQPFSWHTLQQFFAHSSQALLGNGMEHSVGADELVWHDSEDILARIQPALEFWRGTAFLGLLGGGQTIGMNLTDTLLSHTNGLAFEHRLVNHVRERLQSELLLRYLNHDKLEQAVFETVRLRLAPEFIPA